jgi:hypothetical protein
VKEKGAGSGAGRGRVKESEGGRVRAGVQHHSRTTITTCSFYDAI